VNSETATRKEHLDAVIGELDSLLDPARQPRDRGFDFTQDYVVWNTLANRLFKRRLFEPTGSVEREAFLLRAVSAGQRVLALEAEDVTAHDLLALAYSELAGAAGTPRPPQSMSAEVLVGRATEAVDTSRPIEERIEACLSLSADVPALAVPRMPVIREARAVLSPAFQAEKEPRVRAAMAAALAALHRQAHATFKPDEIARGRATRIYRENHPEANYAARDRVIYPTTAAQREAIRQTGDLP
jgi:hypothetical protein